MKMKLSFGSSKQVTGEASIVIKASSNEVFCFIAENFFLNYSKWASEVVEFKPLDGNKIFIGAKGKQVRDDNNSFTRFLPCKV
jgi:hypothetical protein